MHYIDIIIAILLLISIIMGWRQGFIRQLFGLLALLLGVFCAYRFSHFTAHYLTGWFGLSEAVSIGVAFAVTFIVVLLAVVFVGRLADRIISLIAFAFLNRLLGAILSLLKASLIIGVLLVIISMLGFVPESHQRESRLYHPLEQVGTTVFPYLQQFVEKRIPLF
ncbi:MAG: CvpA family protein [Prevotellaceae bacterium]|jgi:membrane protein required for colicin V production|nr:CvpA family protein [Prevotellaceae bacterium]